MEAEYINVDFLNNYLCENSISESDLLEELRIKTHEQFEQSHMISGKYQGRFLSWISKLIQPKKILELGTFTGYATLCLAEGLPKDGTITTIDRNEDLASFYLPFFERSSYKNKIETVTDDALSYLQNDNTSWNLVFLDANKRKYSTYFDLLVPRMKSGGVIIADNVLWKGKVLQDIAPKDKMTKALFDFNEKVANDNRVEIIMLPIRDGISLIRIK